MSPEDIQHGMQDIFNTVFRRQDIIVRPELNALDVPGWDSFRYVSLIMATEERFGIKFTDDDIDHLTNVGELLEAVARKTGTTQS